MIDPLLHRQAATAEPRNRSGFAANCAPVVRFGAISAADLRVGDVVEMATGPVVILRRDETHGGVELLVRSRFGRGGRGTGKTPRMLWFWRRQVVTVSGSEALSDASCSPGRVGRAGSPRRTVSDVRGGGFA